MTKRQETFQRILDIVENNAIEKIPQSVLISGGEGAGKSFILERLRQELTALEYQVMRLQYPYCNIQSIDTVIGNIPVSNGRNTVVMIDDFDELLNILTLNEQYKLRAFLFKDDSPTLIATSTGVYDGFSDYQMPFYDAFRVFHIPSLELDDLAEILSATVYQAICGKDDVRNILPLFKNNLHYLCSFCNAVASGMDCEEATAHVIKENRRYFRHFFSSLPIAQQETLYGLAHCAETATSNDIQQKIGIPATTISSALFRLEKQKIIYKVGEKKRNVNYQFSDYMFGKWLGAFSS